MSTRLFRPLLVAGTLLALALPTSAQTTLSLSGGRNSWDLAGTGEGWTAAIAAERPLTGVLAIEGRVAYFTAPDADDDPFRALFPEIGLVVATRTSVPLRLTVGGGWSLGLGGWQKDELTLFGAAGAHIGVGSGWAVRPEVRVRAVDPWVGTVGEFTLGIARSFGR